MAVVGAITAWHSYSRTIRQSVVASPTVLEVRQKRGLAAETAFMVLATLITANGTVIAATGTAEKIGRRVVRASVRLNTNSVKGSSCATEVPAICRLAAEGVPVTTATGIRSVVIGNGVTAIVVFCQATATTVRDDFAFLAATEIGLTGDDGVKTCLTSHMPLGIADGKG